MARKLIILFVFIFVAFTSSAVAATGIFPVAVEIIDRNQANYLTPENTLFAIHSCLLAQNLDWCDETSTNESLQAEIESFASANIDRTKMFELEQDVKESFITNKLNYKEAILLIVEDHDNDGTIMQLPITLVLENGLWKQTNKFGEDDELAQHLYLVPPLYYGKGQSPAEVNKFLGYEQPTLAKTELPAGITSYTLLVYYGKTVLPNTFKAEINRQDITSLFSPQPFTDQEVEIPLQKGRNVLVLSIDGTKSKGKKGSDTDRLTFIVP